MPSGLHVQQKIIKGSFRSGQSILAGSEPVLMFFNLCKPCIQASVIPWFSMSSPVSYGGGRPATMKKKVCLASDASVNLCVAISAKQRALQRLLSQ
jgi:hypothetical protein